MKKANAIAASAPAVALTAPAVEPLAFAVELVFGRIGADGEGKWSLEGVNRVGGNGFEIWGFAVELGVLAVAMEIRSNSATFGEICQQKEKVDYPTKTLKILGFSLLLHPEYRLS